jgi:putative membrane protein
MRDDGPRATDVLANERTFLAYIRTSLTFIAFGFAVARFALLGREISGRAHASGAAEHLSSTFGSTFVVFGAIVAAYGCYRYVVTDRSLKRERITALSERAAIAGAVVIAALAVTVAVALATYH